MERMKLVMYGTRGSMAVSSPAKVKYGGNTTCVRVISQCIPPNMVFAIDGGTGIFPLSAKTIADKPHLVVLQTHWHWDHLIGLTMAPHVLAEIGRVHIFGPEENGLDVKKVMAHILRKPFFPVEYEEVKHRFKCRTFKNPANQVLVVHPESGVHLLPVSKYRRAISDGKQIQLGDRREDISECLVVKMHKTEHPDFAVSYRLEENPTGRIAVFMTDHEKQACHPAALVEHVRGAHLLVEDAQYSEEQYATKTAGFGHGTPQSCVELAMKGGVEKLYTTHHDPMALDSDIDAMVQEAIHFSTTAIESAKLKLIAAAADYQEIEV